MSSVLAALALRNPDEIVLDDQRSVLTAGELLRRVAALAEALSARRISRLALLAANSVEWVIADLACQEAGICLLPLPPFFADTQITNSLHQVGVDAVLTDDPDRIRRLIPALPASADADLPGALQLVAVAALAHQPIPRGTDKITFTSGSTGAPRGVCLSTGQQLQVAESLRQLLPLSGPRHLCLLPLCTLLENIGGVYLPLLAAGSVLVPPESATGFSGTAGLRMQSMLSTLAGHRPTSIILLPQMLVGLVAALQDGWAVPPELEFAAVGGARVAPELLRMARKLGLPVFEGYGLSELASVACINLPGDELIGSVGKPLPHIALRVDAGEIVIGGNGFLGYVGQPETWGCGEVRTGDLGRIDAAGFVHVSGRSKNVLISSLGRNISPEWVESELLLNAEIAECIVCGDDRPYCTALIFPANDAVADTDIQLLIDAVNVSLPDYARIHRWYRLPERLALNRSFYTDNGRPRRTEILEHFGPTINSLYAEPQRRTAL